MANLKFFTVQEKLPPPYWLLGDLYRLELPTRAFIAYEAALDLEGNLPPSHYIRAAAHLADQKAHEEADKFTAAIQKSTPACWGCRPASFLNLRARRSHGQR